LIDQIPTETKALFAYPIHWSNVDKYKIVQEKITPWIKKKTIEYLGEEAPSMVQFVLNQLQKHASPLVLLDELSIVLEEDAEELVKLLWRKLAFEALRAE
jgi:RNA-binding protein 25